MAPSLSPDQPGDELAPEDLDELLAIAAWLMGETENEILAMLEDGGVSPERARSIAARVCRGPGGEGSGGPATGA